MTYPTPSYLYDVEPITPLHGDKPASWGELLLKSFRFPMELQAARQWYATLAENLPIILRDSPYSRISINVDTQHVLDSHILQSLRTMPKNALILEWTERRASYLGLLQLHKAGRYIQDLATYLGAQIALDDLFAGEDGFRRLCCISPSIVKIAGDIFHFARDNDRVAKMLRDRIVAFQAAGVDVVVEWIESEEDLILARQSGASLGQGFFWKRPTPRPLPLHPFINRMSPPCAAHS